VRGQAGVVDQAGHRAERGCGGESRSTSAGSATSAATRHGPAAAGLDRPDDPLGGLPVMPVVDDDLVAGGGQVEHGGRADAATAAGDDGDHAAIPPGRGGQ
jgi:hypothetical protein